MRMTHLLIVFVVFGATMLAQGATRKVDFSDDPLGQPPKGFELGHTAKAGAPGTLTLPGRGALRRQRSRRRRISPIQTSVRPHRSGRGSRVALSRPGQLLHRPSEWSTLRIVATGPLFEVHLNGIRLYDVEDRTFTAAGKVGVWTKADSVTQFDDVTVVTK